jgi:hypothetical protein
MAADYQYKFARITLSGDCYGGAEQWATGLQMGEIDADVTTIQPLAAEKVADAFKVFFQNSTYHFSNSFRFTQSKVALINTNGTTDTGQISYHTLSPVSVGGSPDNPMPAQITLAATMSSQLQRGLASKGRMYLPGFAHTVESGTGKVPSARTAEIATGFKAFLDALNASLFLPAKVVLASKGHKTNTLDENGQPVYTDGIQTVVTGVRIGNVLDTQRRRRNQLTEQYSTATLA